MKNSIQNNIENHSEDKRKPTAAAGVLRRVMPLLAVCVLAAGLMLSACSEESARSQKSWHGTDVTGSFPALHFAMLRANDGKTVTAEDYKGKIVLLYFGYTFCPDICPNTLENMATVLDHMGKDADKVRFLFVTVDPNRDTAEVMKKYVAVFAPQMDGMIASPDELMALTRRYRIAYSVKPATPDTPREKGHDYEVSHSSAVYIFDEDGNARLVATGFSGTDKIPDMESDLKRLIAGSEKPGLLQRIFALF